MAFYAVTYTSYNGEIKNASPCVSFDASFDSDDEAIEYVNKQVEEYGPKYLYDSSSNWKIMHKASKWGMSAEIRNGLITYTWTIISVKTPAFDRYSTQRRSELEQTELKGQTNAQIRQIWDEWKDTSAEDRANTALRKLLNDKDACFPCLKQGYSQVNSKVLLEMNLDRSKGADDTRQRYDELWVKINEIYKTYQNEVRYNK